MDHVVAPLDGDHVRCLRRLRRRTVPAAEDDLGHITIATFERLDHSVSRQAVRTAVATVAPFVARAHGYGFFVDETGEVSLYVPVVRDHALDALHAAITESLRNAGASIAPWTEAPLWSPHITIASGVLTAAMLGTAVTELARRHHPSWHVPVRHVQLVAGRHEHQADAGTLVPLTG